MKLLVYCWFIMALKFGSPERIMDGPHILPLTRNITVEIEEYGDAAGASPPLHRSKVRGREPNSLLDQEAVRSEKVRSYKNSRAGYLSWLTKLYGETERLMTDFDGFKQVLVKRDMINTAFSRVEQVHCSLLACLEENEEREKADESFMIQVERRQNFMARLDSWVKRAEARTEQSVPHVGPEDSISQSGASKSSRSRASS